MFFRRRLRFAFAAFLAVLFCSVTTYAQTNGGACPTNTVLSNSPTSFVTCTGNLWMPDALQPGAATASCAAGTAGQIQWTGSALQYCNGSTWNSLSGGSSTITLGTSTSATNPQRSGDVTTGLFSAATQTVSVAAGGADVVDIGTNGLNIANGVLTGASQTNNFLDVTGTLPTTSNVYGVGFQITGAGSTAHAQGVFQSTLNAGYTGSSQTSTITGVNNSAGTGNAPFASGNPAANYGGNIISDGTTTDANVGLAGTGYGSSVVNIGLLGKAPLSTNSATVNIGVAGEALSASTVNVGGVFTLMTAQPTFSSSAALIADNGTTSSPIFVAQSNGVALDTIGSTGNVGIGTASPTATLDVRGVLAVGGSPGGVGAAGDLIVNRNDGTGAIYFGNSASPGSHYLYFDTTPQFRFTDNVRVGTGVADSRVYSNPSNQYAFGAINGSGNGYFYFGATASATPDAVFSNNSGTERMRITNGGLVGIGTPSPAEPLEIYSSGSGVLLQLAGSSGTCNHTPGSSSETVSCSSDMRLKSDAIDAPSALPWLSSIRVRDFTWTHTGQKRTGVIAQELQKTHPEMVTYNRGTDEWTVEQPNPWTLVKILQEQQAEIDDLKKQLASEH